MKILIVSWAVAMSATVAAQSLKMRRSQLILCCTTGGKQSLRWIRKRLPRPSKREGVAITILLVPVLAGVVLAAIDESSDATLVVDKPSPTKEMKLRAGDRDGSSSIHARARILTFRDAAPDEVTSSSVSRQVELVLPISKAACLQLRVEIGGACGESATAPIQAAAPFALEWPSTGKVMIEAHSSVLTSVHQTPLSGTAGGNAWTFQFDASVTMVEMECPEEAWFRVVFKGHRPSGRCVRGGTNYRLKLHLDSYLIPENLSQRTRAISI